MRKIGSFFKLVRWPNLLITALMMCLVYHCLILMPSTAVFTMLVISMVLIVAGGYVINDVFDVETDAINKPKKLIVGKVFSEKQCKIFYWALTIIGLCCALVSTIIALGAKFYMVFICMALLAAVLYSYSSTYKKKLVVGNVIVSLSVAFAVFLPWLFVMLYMSENPLLLRVNENLITTSLRIVLFYTGFAFLTTLIREIVKDMEDVEGDGRTHCRTLPVVKGLKISTIVVAVLVTLLIGFLIYFTIYVKRFGKSEIAVILIRAMYMASIVVIWDVFNAKDSKNTKKIYHRISNFMKFLMLWGVLSMLFVFQNSIL